MAVLEYQSQEISNMPDLTVDRRKEGRKEGRKAGRKDGRTDGRMDGRMDGWKAVKKEGRIEGWKNYKSLLRVVRRDVGCDEDIPRKC
jgi:hypothetical protein